MCPEALPKLLTGAIAYAFVSYDIGETADRRIERIGCESRTQKCLPVVNPEPVILQGPSVYTGPTGHITERNRKTDWSRRDYLTTAATWRAVMINRKHIDHAELLELGKLLLLLMKQQQIELNVSSERNQRMTEVEKLARAS